MSTIPANPASQSNAAAARRRSAILVSACTVLNAIAQILFKMGSRNLVLTPMGLATNVPLIVGCAFYGLFTIAMVVALREAELSVMYPIIALSYVWVTLLTYWLLKETPNVYKNLGILTIVIGVAVLWPGRRKEVTAVLVRSIVLVFLAGIVGSFGAVFLKLGALRLNHSVLSFVNSRLIFGVSLYLGSTVIYLSALKGGELSVLYPMVSLGYIWTLVWSKVFFKEAMTRYKFVGLALIVLGVVLVGIGSAR